MLVAKPTWFRPAKIAATDSERTRKAKEAWNRFYYSAQNQVDRELFEEVVDQLLDALMDEAIDRLKEQREDQERERRRELIRQPRRSAQVTP